MAHEPIDTRIRFYVDMCTGTYGDAEDIVVMDVSDWEADEAAAFDNLSDTERIDFVLQLGRILDGDS